MINPFSLTPLKQAFNQTRHLDQGVSQVPSPATGKSQGQSTAHFVRAARLEDLSNIATLLSESFYPADGLTSWFSPLLRLGIYQDLRGRITTSAKHLCLVAFQGDPSLQPGRQSLAGTVEVTLRSLTPWQGSLSKYPYISNLAVKGEFRRQGIAQHLLLTCARSVQEWGYQDLYLHVLEDNQAARQLYAKAGYQQERSDPTWTAYLLRQPQRLLLRKRLK